MLPIFISKFARKKILPQCFFVPLPSRIKTERWLRGSEEYTKLSRADVVVVSYGKSGRTWLRVMLSRFYQRHFGLPEDAFLNFDNLHRMNAAVPKIFFTHDNFIKDYTGNRESKRDFYNKKVVLLVRDPRDVAVSQYFSWKHRMSPGNEAIDQYPPHGEDTSIYDFVMKPESGLPSIIEFLNLWSREHLHFQNLLLVRYEDIRADTEHHMQQLLNFLGLRASDDEVKDVVDYAAYEKMKKREQSGNHASGRLAPTDPNNPDSYKVRRAKVGGYRDYFDPQQLAEIDRLLSSQLDSSYGYHSRNPTPGPGGI